LFYSFRNIRKGEEYNTSELVTEQVTKLSNHMEKPSQKIIEEQQEARKQISKKSTTSASY